MQRSDQRERDTGFDGAGFDLDSPSDTAAEDGRKRTSVRFGVRRRLGGLFSVRWFLLALVLSVVGIVVGGAVPLVGFVTRLLGLLAAGFALGLLSSRRRYVEVGLAGGIAAGLGFVLSTLTSAFFPFAVRLLADYGVAIAGVGAVTGALVMIVGHYLGRDLRGGLTRDL